MSERDQRITDLLAGEWEWEADDLMASLQRDLRAGDRDLAAQLLAAVRGDGDAENRSLLLETLACARVPELSGEVAEAVREALGSTHRALRFSGVACASDLSREEQERVRPRIAELAATGGGSIALAAAVFLENRQP
jgi:hypothetical protein